MTNTTRPLDIEARELLANAMDAEFHRPMRSKEIREGWRLEIAEKCALSAITELLTRLREVEDSEKDWKRRSGLHSRQTSNTQERLDKMRIERDASQALLEECRTGLGQISRMKAFPDSVVNITTLSAARQIAASLIEKLEGMG